MQPTADAATTNGVMTDVDTTDRRRAEVFARSQLSKKFKGRIAPINRTTG